MNNILKRLELIKTSILLEDEEIIELQYQKLISIYVDNDLKNILDKLESKNYGSLIIDIENYLKKYTGVAIYEDKEIHALRLELKSLEVELEKLVLEKNDCINKIEEFNRQYTLKLGTLINSILELKKELLSKQMEDINPFDDDFDIKHEELKEEFEDINKDYEEFNEQYKEKIKEIHFDLNEDETKELKKLFRKACKLCHPDIVSEEFKEQAHQIMQELNESYSKKDLQKVKDILESLENGNFFTVASDTINDKDKLREKVNILREEINKIGIEINTIENDETFKLINSLENNWDNYFQSLEVELEKEKKEIINLIDEPKTKKSEPIIQDNKPLSDDYWDLAF